MIQNSKKLHKFAIITLIIIFLCNYCVLYSENWWHVYFTSPGEKKASQKSEQNPESAITDLLKNTKISFYGAFFEINAKPVIDEIINTYERGVDVRLVIEKDNVKKDAVKILLKSGIPVVADNRNGFMHNKFAVFDNAIVWTGSYNLTFNDGHKNNNNAIEIHSEEIAKIYLDEFNEMFDQKIFGNKKEYTVFSSYKKKYYVKIKDTDINVYFSPEDNIERIILERIKKAKKSVHFMAFSFTSEKLGEEMIRLRKKGILVGGIIEKIGSNTSSSEYVKMRLEGIQVLTDKNKYRMHHKVIIIDEETVITGSYNFSKNANEKNDENIIILHNKEIAGLFFKEFLKLIKK
jgi:phosphatidylserine/phosphatidylglycerophosphate/cardiolipin synthase-like enzyme